MTVGVQVGKWTETAANLFLRAPLAFPIRKPFCDTRIAWLTLLCLSANASQTLLDDQCADRGCRPFGHPTTNGGTRLAASFLRFWTRWYLWTSQLRNHFVNQLDSLVTFTSP